MHYLLPLSILPLQNKCFEGWILLTVRPLTQVPVSINLSESPFSLVLRASLVAM